MLKVPYEYNGCTDIAIILYVYVSDYTRTVYLFT